MYGTITIKEYDVNDVLQSPVGLEYGLSLSRIIPPLSQQMSNVFSQLTDGNYYIWYREIGGQWSEQNVINQVVACQTIANNQQLIENYINTNLGGLLTQLQQTAAAAVQDLVQYIFQANNTSVGNVNAIHSEEDYSSINLSNIAAVFIDGVYTPYKSTVPISTDNTTQIFNDNGVLKWKASNAPNNHELTSNMLVSLLVIE